MLCGAVRGIPPYWRVLDASFGLLAAIPLALARSCTVRLAAIEQTAPTSSERIAAPRALA